MNLYETSIQQSNQYVSSKEIEQVWTLWTNWISFVRKYYFYYTLNTNLEIYSWFAMRNFRCLGVAKIYVGPIKGLGGMAVTAPWIRQRFQNNKFSEMLLIYLGNCRVFLGNLFFWIFRKFIFLRKCFFLKRWFYLRFWIYLFSNFIH